MRELHERSGLFTNLVIDVIIYFIMSPELLPPDDVNQGAGAVQEAPHAFLRYRMASLGLAAMLTYAAGAEPAYAQRESQDAPTPGVVAFEAHAHHTIATPEVSARPSMMKIIEVNAERNSIDHRGKARTTRLARIVLKHEPAIAVFVETEPVQNTSIRRVMHGSYGFVSSGGEMATGRVTNVIAYKKSELKLTGTDTYSSIAQLLPDRTIRKVHNAIALFRVKGTPTVDFAVAATHDPIGSASARVQARARATKQTHRFTEGMLIAGDFNDTVAACKQFARSGIHTAAALGKKGCRQASLHIDQIFGTHGITFRGTRWNTQPRKTTDHGGMLVTTAVIPARRTS
jgi:hypothetical protein